MKNPFKSVNKTLSIGSNKFNQYCLKSLKDSRLEKLPYSIRVLLESAVRNCDEFNVKKSDVDRILAWETNSTKLLEIPFKPARVLLQDFTGVPAVVDLAAMRDAMERLGGDPNKINPLVPVDLVIDHSVQVDKQGTAQALDQNEQIEFDRNRERFEFLKWGQSAFKNMLVVPPGSGIVHQVNLEQLARGIMNTDNMLQPDSVVGTDSHTTMINGLGVLGWGVGGIEAEAVMLGQSISMVLPEVVGFRLEGNLPSYSTATDLVLQIVNMLRKRGVVGKFVEFFGPGVDNLTVADRSTIANMAPEQGATCGFFAFDDKTIDYMKTTGRGADKLQQISEYLKQNSMMRDQKNESVIPTYSGEIMNLDMGKVEPCLSGPKRPHDKVLMSDLPKDFADCLPNKNGFKGFEVAPADINKSVDIVKDGKKQTLKHGAVVIAAITSCTNTSNPDVMMQAGMLCQNANQVGLKVPGQVKTSLSPGSGVVQKQLEAANLKEEFEKQGFFIAGFGCMTCIGNSGELDQEVTDAIDSADLVASAVLSGNRNFEARVHRNVKAAYLASPPLVVAYALAGRCDIDFEKEPLGQSKDGKDIFLRDIWPSREQVLEKVQKNVKSSMFTEVQDKISKGTDRWNALDVPNTSRQTWKPSTQINNPPFFSKLTKELPTVEPIKDAHCLLNMGNSITTDHISPAGNIAVGSAASKQLESKGVKPKDYNTYGARRGNDEVMMRGTFANIRLINKMASKTGPTTLHVPSQTEMLVQDAAEKYMEASIPTIILAGQEQGSGSSRDWAAKGPMLQGVKCVIAESQERIHRSNLVGMGILPLQFQEGQTADSLGLNGQEVFTVDNSNVTGKPNLEVNVTTKCGKKFTAFSRLDTEVELTYQQGGGILHTVLRRLLNE